MKKEEREREKERERKRDRVDDPEGTKRHRSLDSNKIRVILSILNVNANQRAPVGMRDKREPWKKLIFIAHANCSQI